MTRLESLTQLHDDVSFVIMEQAYELAIKEADLARDRAEKAEAKLAVVYSILAEWDLTVANMNIRSNDDLGFRSTLSGCVFRLKNELEK